MAIKQLRPLLLLLALLVFGVLIWTAYTFFHTPNALTISGESTTETQTFRIAQRRYDLQADLLPNCQYTLYLTPEGQPWDKAGKAIASASGEHALQATTDVLNAGRYFIHSLTNPDEGCSWTLRMKAK
ncbi:hypothetical protein [Deinococcus ruber]|uniref:Uncharacterized protein n=1 Tax=Deinococcus ruber TaxID=1848197 RepID=A0A918C2I7_9DEIO|nr:hypothetical protein [Deinococcus ruber]GGR00698.1 hypothetical protein GCM10008957_11910 [Deinococcus ruber]